MATNAGEITASSIQDRMKEIHNLVAKDLPSEHNKSAATITAINKIHEKVAKQDDKKLTPANKKKLDGLYSTALAEALNEERVVREALEKIYEIQAIKKNEQMNQAKSLDNQEPFMLGGLMRSLQTSAVTMPLWIGKPGEKPPPLCGAIPAELSHVAEVGHMVAALQKSPEGDEIWILAEVVRYDATTGSYQLKDIDEEQKEKIMLTRHAVIPLPLMRANPGTHPQALFPKSSEVMAVYPQTTCFYKGVINSTPVTPFDNYTVVFEDANYSGGYTPAFKVAQRYVIATRDKEAK